MLICFFTIDEILGRAGLKDMTKGVLSVFVAFCSCGCSVACRDVTCVTKYRAKICFFKKQIYFSYSSFCCLFYQARHLRRWDQSAVDILYYSLRRGI